MWKNKYSNKQMKETLVNNVTVTVVLIVFNCLQELALVFISLLSLKMSENVHSLMSEFIKEWI